MTKMLDVSPRLGVFIGEMMRKLSVEKNQAKGDWRECTIADLVALLKKELAEMEKAIASKKSGQTVEECADVANFAFMIADICKTYRDEVIEWDSPLPVSR